MELRFLGCFFFGGAVFAILKLCGILEGDMKMFAERNFLDVSIHVDTIIVLVLFLIFGRVSICM